MRRTFLLLIAVIILPNCPSFTDAAWAGKTDEKIDNPHLWQPKTKSVAVFKNGFGFFMREGEVVGRDGWAVAKEIPPAAFGTLAVYAKNENQLVDIVGAGPGEVIEFDDVDASSDNNNKRERLSAAKNMKVQLTYRYKDADRTAAGKLVSIGPEFVVLDTDGNSAAVPVDGISKLQILDLPLRVHVTADGDKPVEQTTLGMAYLRQGITWIPEYSLKVIDDQNAELTLRGTLVNEAEDLVHADVNFVVGVPHFLHTGYLAPIAVGQVIRTIGAAVAPNEVGSQIMSRAAISNNSIRANQFDAANPGVVEQPVQPDGGDLAGKLGNLPQLEGPGGSDYTVYTKNDLTVRRGERAIVTLFVRKIKYSHIYRWSPPAMMEHSLVLQNDTDTAWTTGPCLGMSGGRPLSEDLLKYTPRGGKSELPVSAAINISHEKSEAEADRKFKAHSPADRVFYDLVTLTGELKLRNFEAVNAEVVVTNAVPGKPVEASDDGKLTSDATKLQLLERAGTFEWRITLKPKETKVLKYKYERYVPSN